MTPRSLFLTAVASLTLIVGGAVLIAPPVAAVDTTTCLGKPVTLVASGGTVTGTDGDDVVAVVQDSGVSTGAGNDTVCLFGGAILVLDTGAGDDDVDTSGATPGPSRPGPQVALGPGNDTFVGGAADDIVWDGVQSPSGAPDPAGDDTIDTGAGNDVVTHSGGDDRIVTGAGDDGLNDNARVRTAATVDLGDGDDRIDFGFALPSGIVHGGPGSDRLASTTAAKGSLAINARAGTVTADGATTPFDGFERYGVATIQPGVRSSFTGTDGPDQLEVTTNGVVAPAARPGPITASMAGGDDVLQVDEGALGTWDAGAGTDSLRSTRQRKVAGSGDRPSLKIYLAQGRYQVRGSARTSLMGFEDVQADSWNTVVVRGGAGAQSIGVIGCEADVDAGGGADRIDFDRYSKCKKNKPGVLTARGGGGADVISGARGPDVLSGDGGSDVIKGRGGADVLRGGSGADRLVGGPGRDTAYGDGGRDTCRTAERQVSCER